MTTAASIPINTYQDILDALERDPGLRAETRRHFLGEEYLRLPEIVADLAAMVKQVSDVVGAMAEGQARAETDIAELKDGQARTQADITELKDGQARMEERQTRTEADIAELKESQARTQADIAELKDGQARMEERQTRTEADIAELKESQARTQADIAELKDGQARMEERQTRTEADIADLKDGQARMEERQTRTEADVSELKDTQANLITEVASLRSTVETMGNTVNRLDNTVDSMRGTLNRLDGTDYERTAARRIRRSGGRRLGLTRPVIVQARTLPENDIIPSLLDDAVDDGRITEEQADEIDLVDIIVRGNDPDGILTYAAAEVSLTIEIHDVTRAHDRARLLALATRAPVKAAVIGTAITDDAQDAALSHDVTCIVLPQ